MIDWGKPLYMEGRRDIKKIVVVPELSTDEEVCVVVSVGNPFGEQWAAMFNRSTGVPITGRREHFLSNDAPEQIAMDVWVSLYEEDGKVGCFASLTEEGARRMKDGVFPILGTKKITIKEGDEE